MREILFRGKRVDNGEWAYGWFYSVKNAFNEKHILKIIIDVHGNETFVNPETVGQYTGLTDKNGTKIFENDILVGHLDDLFPDDETELIVEWHDYGWFGKEEKGDYISLDKNWASEFFEVAGNIFDNC